MVTRKDVAKKAGVSTATVSRVTSGRGYVSEEAREKVQKAIGALNYIPNNIAKSLTQNRSNVVAVLVEDLTNPYYLQILDAMEREGAKYNLIISLFAVNKNDIDMVMTGLIENRVCAIINLALFACNEKYISILEELEIYTVNIKPRNIGELRIHLNHALGIDSICAYLRDKGRRRLAYLAALGEELVRQDERLNAYLVSRKKYGLSEDDQVGRVCQLPRRKGLCGGVSERQTPVREGRPLRFRALHERLCGARRDEIFSGKGFFHSRAGVRDRLRQYLYGAVRHPFPQHHRRRNGTPGHRLYPRHRAPRGAPHRGDPRDLYPARKHRITLLSPNVYRG